MDVSRTFFALGSALALAAVAAGAFATHGLEGRLSSDAMATLETGVRYQMYHAVALLAVAWAARQWPHELWTAAGWLFAGGVALFSGTLYALALGGPRWLGAVTPVGGSALLAGWALSIAAALRGGG